MCREGGGGLGIRRPGGGLVHGHCEGNGGVPHSALTKKINSHDIGLSYTGYLKHVDFLKCFFFFHLATCGFNYSYFLRYNGGGYHYDAMAKR